MESVRGPHSVLSRAGPPRVLTSSAACSSASTSSCGVVCSVRWCPAVTGPVAITPTSSVPAGASGGDATTVVAPYEGGISRCVSSASCVPRLMPSVCVQWPTRRSCRSSRSSAPPESSGTQYLSRARPRDARSAGSPSSAAAASGAGYSDSTRGRGAVSTCTAKSSGTTCSLLRGSAGTSVSPVFTASAARFTAPVSAAAVVGSSMAHVKAPYTPSDR
mmetsp:Transcript_4837/g.15648  ORF Transcript_4837/g.15648 Transcript_4837/m.15648 type:complete len:218 (+) Transcript_4837:221-874(+)